jgi:hypothetical protein
MCEHLESIVSCTCVCRSSGVLYSRKPSLEEWLSALLDREKPWDTVLEQEEKFTDIVTVSQSLNAPLLLVLREWIDELLPGR